MASKKANAKKTTKSTAAKTVVRKKTVPSSSSSMSAAKDIFVNAPLGALFGEFIGTFLLAAVVIATSGQPIFVLFGLTAIVLTVGHLSGAHVNPALTFGAWITRKITTKRAVFYVIAQVLGAMFALVVLNYLVQGSPAQANPLTGQPQAAELFQAAQLTKGKEWFAFAASVVGLSIFGFAFASAMREKKEHFASAFTVGGGLFIGLIVAGSTAVLNPAIALALRAFTQPKGATYFSLEWTLAVHVLAPLIGAAIGFLLYDLFRRDVDTVA